MPQIVIIALFLLIIIALCGAFIYVLNKKQSSKPITESVKYTSVSPEVVNNVSLIEAEARAKAKEIILEAKDSALKIRAEASKFKEEYATKEKELDVRKVQLDTREHELGTKARSLKAAKDLLDKKQQEIDTMHLEQTKRLENIASLSKEEARSLVLKQFDQELVDEKGKRLREHEENIKKDADKLAQDILLNAMRYGVTDYVAEYTTSKVPLPDTEMKGRIIGKEGRNITALEELTGVELDLDSTPGMVLISSFDPVRRELAKISLERLIADGRIQPAKIEEIVGLTQKELEHIIQKEGENLCHKVGIYNLHQDLIKMLGRFKYRFSYGQNLTEHTLEETRIGVAIAKEIKANSDIVKLGCLLHDIGKVVTDEEGTHVQLGVDLLRKYNVDPAVVACVAEHHEDKPYSSIESAIVGLSDHISGSRPGARSEDYESYVKRLKDLEDAAYSFDGVDKAYAISAGREVRVFVNPKVVDDASSALLAREIAKKIELEHTYPGVVKVLVIRETRVSETAK